MAESNNKYRLSKLLTDGGTYFAKELLKVEFRNAEFADINTFLNDAAVKDELQRLHTRGILHQSQMDLLYPASGTANIDDIDITLLTCILTNCFKLSASKKTTIKNLRTLRNEFYGHTASYQLDDNTFKQQWQGVASFLVSESNTYLSPDCVQHITDMRKTIEGEILTQEAAEKYYHELRVFLEEKTRLSEENELQNQVLLHQIGAKMSQTSTQLGDMKIKLDTVTGNTTEMKTKLDTVTENTTEMKTKLDTVTENNTEMKTKLDTVTENNTEMKTKLDTVTENNTEMKTKLDTVTENNTEMKTKLDTVTENTTEMKTKLDTVTENTTEMNPKLDTVTENTTEMKTKLDTVTENTTEMKTKLDTVTENNTEMKTKLDTVTENNTEMKTKLDTVTENTTEINTKLDKLTSKFDAVMETFQLPEKGTSSKHTNDMPMVKSRPGNTRMEVQPVQVYDEQSQTPGIRGQLFDKDRHQIIEYKQNERHLQPYTNELLAQTGLDIAVLNRTPTDQELVDLAECVTVSSYRQLAIELNIPYKEVEKIVYQYGKVSEELVIFQILYHWKKRDGSYIFLYKAMHSRTLDMTNFFRVIKGIEREDIIQETCRILEKIHRNESSSLSERDISRIADCIGKEYWMLGIRLGISPHEIEMFDIDSSRSAKSTVFKILMAWHKMSGSLSQLVAALIKCNANMPAIVKVLKDSEYLS